ncbi:SAM-dependent methyltransferase [Saccharopolyspora gloriosae]|uniref:SAM-dependent methyltransferase n=1 Tax=Saccharopolyspora gloriosae TaxID=455344 RepID=UPI001FB7CF64|nr:SAM-dependent methyltransferase [Saccharopolyspora gloriosae]
MELPRGADISKSSASRIYDYGLGGSHNFEVDRRVLDEIKKIFPATPQPARDNRAFLGRAVRHCRRAGIRQFLDLGSGMPTVGNVHEIAQRADPGARVVYVDIDPVAVAYSRSLLGDDPNTIVLQADMREPETILTDPDALALLDFDEPVAVLMVAMTHYLTDEDDPAGVLAAYRKVMRPGSFLVFSHMTADDYPEVHRTAEAFNAGGSEQLVLRSREEITGLLADFEFVEPGLVYPADWRPDGLLADGHDPSRAACYAAVATLRD